LTGSSAVRLSPEPELTVLKCSGYFFLALRSWYRLLIVGLLIVGLLIVGLIATPVDRSRCRLRPPGIHQRATLASHKHGAGLAAHVMGGAQSTVGRDPRRYSPEFKSPA
jgi:hypothetical protein